MARAVADSMLVSGQSLPTALQSLLDAESDPPEGRLPDKAGGSGKAASTVNTSLTNPVLSVFGHAKARAIASDATLVDRTHQEGKRMLTQQSRETKRNAKGRRGGLQLGWIKYRHVAMEELQPVLIRNRLNAACIEEVAKILESTNLVHTVVTNVFDKGFIVTNYFASQHIVDYKDLVRTTLFDFLDNDDPSVITDAMDNPIFVEGLRSEYASGDIEDPRLWKTLSELKAPLNLLHMCCEKDYPDCVELLLSMYAMQTAQEPHYTLVEPDIWVDKWRNTSFHCAAYRGNAKCLRHLISFAKQHSVDITGLKDKDGKTPLDIARGRGHLDCYNMLAPAFNVSPMLDRLGDAELAADVSCMLVDFVSVHESGALLGQKHAEPFEVSIVQLRSWMVMDAEVVKIPQQHSVQNGKQQILIPAGAMLTRVESLDGASVWDTSVPAQILMRRLQSYGEASVRATVALRRKCDIPSKGNPDELSRRLRSIVAEPPNGSSLHSLSVLGFEFLPTEDGGEQMYEWFRDLLQFHTISFRKCTCEPRTILHICRSVRRGLESGLARWSQLYVFPSSRVAGETLPEFEYELPDLVKALRKSSVLQISRSGCRQCGIPAGAVPQSQRCWCGILSHCLDGYRLINTIKNKRDKENSNDIVEASGATHTYFTAGIVHIWRHELDFTRLFDSSVRSTEDALRPGMQAYVREWLRSMSAPFCENGVQISMDAFRTKHDLHPEEEKEYLQHLDLAVCGPCCGCTGCCRSSVRWFRRSCQLLLATACL